MDHLKKAADQAQEDAQDQQEDALERLLRLATEFKEKKNAVDRMETALKEEKERFNKLSQEIIPQSMQQLGLSSFVLGTGESISYKEDISVSVKDYAAFSDFLDSRGDSSILKLTLEIGKVPKDICEKITQLLAEKFGIFADIKPFVHPQTLKKYVKDLCGIDGTMAEIPLAELDENMLKTFLYYKTTVK